MNRAHKDKQSHATVESFCLDKLLEKRAIGLLRNETPQQLAERWPATFYKQYVWQQSGTTYANTFRYGVLRKVTDLLEVVQVLPFRMLNLM